LALSFKNGIQTRIIVKEAHNIQNNHMIGGIICDFISFVNKRIDFLICKNHGFSSFSFEITSARFTLISFAKIFLINVKKSEEKNVSYLAKISYKLLIHDDDEVLTISSICHLIFLLDLQNDDFEDSIAFASLHQVSDKPTQNASKNAISTSGS
jgi:hypothetical protein